MNCRGVSRRLSAYIDDDLSPGIREAVEEHLERCASCKRQLAEFEAIVTAAQSLAQLCLSDGFCESVMKAIRSNQETREVVSALRYRLTLAGVAFMVTAAAIFFLVGPPSHRSIRNMSTTQDYDVNTQGGPDFYSHPETKVHSFPVPEGVQSSLLAGEKLAPVDSTPRVDEFVLPSMEKVREDVSDTF